MSPSVSCGGRWWGGGMGGRGKTTTMFNSIKVVLLILIISKSNFVLRLKMLNSRPTRKKNLN